MTPSQRQFLAETIDSVIRDAENLMPPYEPVDVEDKLESLSKMVAMLARAVMAILEDEESD